MAIEEKRFLDPSDVKEMYVAFVDVLGFSSNIIHDFHSLLQTYENMLSYLHITESMHPEVKLFIFSDSFLLVSETLGPLILKVQALLMQTLFSDFLVRGGIAYGKHLESNSPPHLFMVSEAVVKAVSIEKSIKNPCIAIHPDIEISDDWWCGISRNIERGILYFGGHRIVNPLNIVWGQSAATRVRQMLEEHPEHKSKFEWFLELHQAIFSPLPMVPPKLLQT